MRRHARAADATDAAGALMAEATARLRASGHLYFELEPTGSSGVAIAVRHHRLEDEVLGEYGERFYADDPLTSAFRESLHRRQTSAHGPAIVALGEVPRALRTSYENRFLRRAGIADVLGLGLPASIDGRPRMLCFGFHRGAADSGFTAREKRVLVRLAEGLRLRAENVALREALARRPSEPTIAIPVAMAAAASLTEREREVASLLTAGHGNRQLARELGLTVNTVEDHLRSIYAKLGVRSRGHATARLLGGMPPDV